MAEEKPLFTLDDLLDKTPDTFKPVVTKYAPKLVTWSIKQFWAWIELLALGKTHEAWNMLFEDMPSNEFLQAGNDITARLDAVQDANYHKVALQKEAISAILRVLVTITFAQVGL